jgi:hypothetical protein
MEVAMMSHTPAWLHWYASRCCPAAEAVRLIVEAPKPGGIYCSCRVTRGNVRIHAAPLRNTLVLSEERIMLVLHIYTAGQSRSFRFPAVIALANS